MTNISRPPAAEPRSPRIALYPGTFDPITNGHIDIIERGLTLFDRVIVTIAINVQKVPLFTLEERSAMIRTCFEDSERVSVGYTDGLIVDYALQNNAQTIIRGLRAVSDFDYEFQMALMNRKLSSELETLFLMPKEEYSVLSSRMVREVGSMGGDITGLVPDIFQERVARRLRNPAELG